MRKEDIFCLTQKEKELVEENYGLIFSFLKKYNYSQEDWYDIAAIGLCKAAHSFNPEKGYKFSTYAYKIMRNAIAYELRSTYAEKYIPEEAIVSYDNLIFSSDEEESTYLDILPDSYNLEEEAICLSEYNLFFNQLPERNKQLLSLSEEGYTLSEIATLFQCSFQRVAQLKQVLKEQFLSRISEH